ncbi:MAG: CCA tRNA nucleotidyltransferase [Terracidiphilus sp.]|jgi:tRNA nucleotidyltransferase/poly(A) polymerase
MPDYIYLLENRLSADQQHALRQLREAVREVGTILFLTGDAVRDLTSGHAVRELEVAVHGNALKLKKTIEKLGGTVWGEDELSRTLYLCFPGTVRVDLISTHRAEYPHPGKPVFHSASIQEDLRRRDFTVNAMAISLNEGSFGLLMDPLNGAADIESRTLRLVSNYGFLEEPSLLIRATRYRARLGWEFDSRTRTRYENAVAEVVIEQLSAHARSQELEQIGHEEDGLKVLRALETEGWMKFLFPAWTSARADEEKLKALHELAVELLLQGVHADMSAAQMQLLTAKMPAKELAALKKLLLRPGFVEEWNSLDALAAGFAKVLLAEENSTPSVSYKLFTSYDPEAILWLGFTSKDPAVRERFNQFLKVWPEARQRIPHAQMQEMRITPELAAYREIVQAVFLELIDGRLTTPEEIRAMLEPHSPPAPPPQVTVKRPRAKRGDAKLKEHSYDDDEEESEDGLDEDEDLDDIGGDEDEIDLGLSIPKADLALGVAEDAEPEEDELEAEEPVSVPAKHGKKTPAQPKPAKEAPVPTPAPAPLKAEKRAKAVPVVATVAAKPEKAAKPQLPSKPKPESKQESTTMSTPASKSAKAKFAPAVKKVPPAPVKQASKSVAAGKAASKPLIQGSVKPPVQGSAKSLVQGSVKPPVQGSVKPPVQGSVKPPVQGSVKPPVQGSVKPPVRAAVKAPGKKAAPAKGKLGRVVASKAAKAVPPSKAKPAKTAKKKIVSKPAKMR